MVYAHNGESLVLYQGMTLEAAGKLPGVEGNAPESRRDGLKVQAAEKGRIDCENRFPQGLKPHEFCCSYGAAKAVP